MESASLGKTGLQDYYAKAKYLNSILALYKKTEGVIDHK